MVVPQSGYYSARRRSRVQPAVCEASVQLNAVRTHSQNHAMKARVYMETSVISYLAARPSADAINSTRQYFSYQLWQKRATCARVEAA